MSLFSAAQRAITHRLGGNLHRFQGAAWETAHLHTPARSLTIGSAALAQHTTPPSGTPPNEPIQGGADPSTYTSTAAEKVADYSSLVPRLVVFGGNGYVGTRVCEQALRMGAEVVSVSRRGAPATSPGSWASQVHWEKGDALDAAQPWRGLLKGAAGVVSTLGTFGSNAQMYRVCGQANMELMDAAVAAGVPRFAFISVHDYSFPGGWHAQDFLLKGYFQGKRDAEAHLARTFPDSGVALRPGFIYGTRHTGSMNVPLGLVGAPLAAALKLLPTRRLAGVPIVGAAFVPPVSVDAVGKAAATAALDLSVPPGVMDVWEIASKY